MTRLCFVLKEPSSLDRRVQYDELRAILTPVMRVHCVYSDMGYIANPIDRRAMVFWIVEQQQVAATIQRNVAHHEPSVEGSLWQRFTREYSDHLGRWTWCVKEQQVTV